MELFRPPVPDVAAFRRGKRRTATGAYTPAAIARTCAAAPAATRPLSVCASYSLAALLTALVMALLKKQKIRLADIGSGLLIGIPNYFSARFLLLSLGKIPAVIAYPVYSSGTIMITSMAGLLIFNEKLNFHKKLALVLILSALVLLNLKI